MRLWHIDLIDVLPRQQLLGQWRELNSIFKKQDNHILINKDFTDDIWEKLRIFVCSKMIINETEKILGVKL